MGIAQATSLLTLAKVRAIINTAVPLRDGVTVAHMTLDHVVLVRIQVPQPKKLKASRNREALIFWVSDVCAHPSSKILCRGTLYRPLEVGRECQEAEALGR